MRLSLAFSQRKTGQRGPLMAMIDFLLLVLVVTFAFIILAPLVRQKQEIVKSPPKKIQVKPRRVNEVLSLTEEGGYVFKAGKWQDDEVADKVKTDITPSVAAMITKKFNLFIISGYTDGTPNRGTGCVKWDVIYAAYLAGKGTAPAPCTNMGLAKLRALFVARTLYHSLPANVLSKIQIKAQAGGPDQFIGDNPGIRSNRNRRMIQIHGLRINK